MINRLMHKATERNCRKRLGELDVMEGTSGAEYRPKLRASATDYYCQERCRFRPASLELHTTRSPILGNSPRRVSLPVPQSGAEVLAARATSESRQESPIRNGLGWVIHPEPMV